MRGQRFDVAVVSNPKQELHAAVWLAGIPTRVGYDRKWGWTLTHRLPDEKALGERHEVEYNYDLVRALGLAVSVGRNQGSHFIFPDAQVVQLIEQHGVKAGEPFLTVHPWSSNPIKQWPLDRCRALIKAVVERCQIPVMVVGGQQERRHVKAMLPPEGKVADLVGRLTLTQLGALLQRARLLVSTDSGPMHLAAAVGTPTVALFGSADPATGPRRWGPWGEGHVVICKPSMDAIRVEDVLSTLEQRLAGSR
jgi:ADP-heptose:LPS heptosyltransferase